VYIKCIGTPHKKNKNLRLNEHKGPFLDEKPKKLVDMEECAI
jgi:hypothetical protein